MPIATHVSPLAKLFFDETAANSGPRQAAPIAQCTRLGSILFSQQVRAHANLFDGRSKVMRIAMLAAALTGHQAQLELLMTPKAVIEGLQRKSTQSRVAITAALLRLPLSGPARGRRHFLAPRHIRTC